MKQTPSLTQLGEMAGRFFRRYHVILFSLTIVLGVSVAVFMLNNLLVISSGSDSGTNVATPTTFDQQTIEAIEKFSTASENQEAMILPSGRINPLVE